MAARGTSTTPGNTSGDPAPETPRNNTSHAYENVRELILEGKLPPGTWVSQTQLAESLSISRTPLREALRRLQTEGLVQLDFNRRVKVAALSVVDLEALYSLRLINEPLAAMLSVPLLTDEDLAEIKTELDAMNAAAMAQDEPNAIAHHRQFHFGLIRHAADRIRAQVEGQWDHSVRYVKLYQNTPSHRLALIVMGQEGHAAIYAAAVARDGGLVARLISEHIGRTALTVIANIDGSHEPYMVRQALKFAMGATAAVAS